MQEKLTREERRKALGTALLIVLFALILAGIIFWYANRDEDEVVSTPTESAELRQAAEELDTITVRCDFDPDTGTLTGTSQLVLENRTGKTLDRTVLRSWSSAYQTADSSPWTTDELYDTCYPEGFSAGGLTVLSATLNGVEAEFTLSDDAGTVIEIPADWAPGEKLQVDLTWSVTVPDCAASFGLADGVWSFSHVLPQPAVYDGEGWRTDPYLSTGDSFLAECADWQVRLTAPEGWQAAATGYAASTRTDGRSVWNFTASAVRDFSFALSRGWQEAAGMTGDTLIIVRAGTRKEARSILKTAKKALKLYNSLYGEYPYPTLTLAETGLSCLDEQADSCLCLISAGAVESGGDRLEYAVAEAVAHEWWGILVGNDGYNQPWQDDSLCEYALLEYIGSENGEDSRQSAAFERVETALRITIPSGVTPGSPVDRFGTLSEAREVVSRRGAALWLALENLLGHEELNRELLSYRSSFAFRIAGREEMEQLLEAESGRSLQALFLDYLDTNMN